MADVQTLNEINASRGRIERVLRTLRPIPERYYLQDAALYENQESCPILERITGSRTPPGLHISPDPCFIHSTVRDWISDNSMDWVTETFLEMGIYQHEDVVHVACGLRLSSDFRQEFQKAMNLNSPRWLSVESVLMRYARPVNYPFVKGSKVGLNREARHEYLFDEEQWELRMQFVRDERFNGEQRRERQ